MLKYLPYLLIVCGMGCIGSDDDDKKSKAELNFTACDPLVKGGQPGECASTKVPLLWDQTGGKEISIFVKRIPATKERTCQVWLLDGGPGGNGAGYEMMPALQRLRDNGCDVYIPAHRGTGRSTALDCEPLRKLRLLPLEEQQKLTPEMIKEENKKCAQEVKAAWGDDLRGFSSHGAAQDLGYLIDATHEENIPVTVLGSSYGTYWAERYLQYHPHQAQAVVLDSVLDLDSDVWNQNIYVDEVATGIVDYCIANAEVCKQRYTMSSKATMTAAFEKMRAKKCQITFAGAPTAITGDAGVSLLKSSWGLAVQSAPAMLPALIHRSERCNAEDQAVISRYLSGAWVQEYQAAKGVTPEAPPTNVEDLSLNDVLYSQVTAEDLIPPGVNFDDVYKNTQNLFFSDPDQAYKELYEDWTSPKRNEINNQHAKTDVPMLILNGDFDLATPTRWALKTRAAFKGDHQHFVRFPTAGHGTFGSTPLPDQSQCSEKIILAFIQNPKAELDTSCVSQVVMPDYAAERPELKEFIKYAFGNENMWGTP